MGRSTTGPPSVELAQILREELWRSVAWAGLGLVGWAFIVTSTARLDATVWTVIGLPVLTWAALTVGMIGLRLVTGSALQVRTTEGLHIVLLEGFIVTGFIIVYLVTVEGWSPLPTVGGYLAITAVYLVYYLKIHLPRSSLTTAR